MLGVGPKQLLCRLKGGESRLFKLLKVDFVLRMKVRNYLWVHSTIVIDYHLGVLQYGLFVDRLVPVDHTVAGNACSFL